MLQVQWPPPNVAPDGGGGYILPTANMGGGSTGLMSRGGGTLPNLYLGGGAVPYHVTYPMLHLMLTPPS